MADDSGSAWVVPSTTELRRQVRAYCAEAVAAGVYEPSCDSWLHSFDPAFSRSLGEQGWLGMTWPRQYGGSELSPAHRFAVLEELLVAGAPVAAHWMAERQTGPLLLRYGTETQRARYLAEIAAGQLYVSVALSEPGSGSDLASVSTRAVMRDGRWHLNGHKIWISNAHRTHLLVVLARTAQQDDRHAGLTQFIVPTDSRGVTVEPIAALTGGSDFCEVFFDDVVVGEDSVVGEVGRGWAQVNSELASERSGPDRYLSVYPLLAAFLDQAHRPLSAMLREVGRSVAALWSLHSLAKSMQPGQRGQSGDGPQAMDIALLKDQGTSFEQDLVETLRRELASAPQEADEAVRRLLDAAVLAAPSFSLRGGTNEILRTVIGKKLVGR